MNQTTQQADTTIANTVPPHADAPVTIAAVHGVPQGAITQVSSDTPPVVPKPTAAGKPPVPTAAAAIQAEMEAASAQARQAADKLLRKKRLGESEGDQSAESSVDSSYDVVAANTTEAAAPAEEAATASATGGSAAAASGGLSWIPIAGGGLGLAAIGGGGGAAAVAASSTVSTFAVSIAAVAGPITAALNYKIYDAQGNVIASGVTDATGRITVNLASTYAGQPLLIKITDANGAAPDYRDETTNGVGAGTDLGSTALRAAFVASGSSQSITVSPVTDLAVQKMGITTDAATVSAATVTATNASVGAALGVSDILGAVTTVLSADYNEANGLNAAEVYGQLLAKFSGQDQTSGSVGATLAAFLAAINTVDPVARQTALNNLLTNGANNFEAGVNTGAVDLVDNPTLVITDSVAGTANGAMIYTFTFSDAVTGFDAADITVTNGTKGTFTAVSATIYTLVVTPTANAEGADIGVTVNSGTGGIGHHSTLTATIAQNAAAQAYDTIVPAAPGTPDLDVGSDTGGSNTDNNTSNTAPTITGTAEANSTVKLYEGVTEIGSGTATAGGTYSIVTNTLIEGAHTITAKATDAAGNVSVASSGLTVTIDTTTPAVAAIGMVATDDVVNVSEQTATITGTNEAGATVTLNLGGVNRTATVSGTTWSYTLTATDITNMGEGAETLTVTQTDAAGNTSTGVTRPITVDTMVPVAPVVDIVATDDIVNASEQVATITGTNETGATVALSLGGNTRAATVTGTTWSYTLTPADITGMGQGAETLSVTQTDAAGNVSTAATRPITVATQGPVISSVALTSATGALNNTLNVGDTVTATITFSEAVTVTGTPQLALNIGGTPVQADYVLGSGSTALTFSYIILAGQTDANGIAVTANGLTLNTGTIKDAATSNAVLAHTAVADNATYMVDTTAPVMVTTSFNAPENGTAVATLTANDANALTWSTSLTGMDAGLFALTSGGVLTFQGTKNFEAPDDNGANHVYDLGVQVTDAAGNTTTQAITVNLTNVNEAPTAVGTVATQTAVTTQPFSLDLSSYFTDVDAGDTRHYSATGLQPGLSIDINTGIISGTASADHAASPVVVTMTDSGALSTTQTFDFGVVSVPALLASQSLDGVNNLDVTSALVIAFDKAITLNSTGTQHIKIFDDMGTTGWTVTNTTSSESKQDTFDNDVDITMTNGVATAVTIGGVDYTSRFDLANSVKVAGNNLVINLLQATGSHAGVAGATDSIAFDWDFGANYHVNLDAGVVVANGQGNAALINDTTLNFTTVAPVAAATGAASQQMDLTGANAALSAGYTWHSGHVQDDTSPGLALDFSVGAHALYIQSDGGNNRTSTMTGRVLISGMSINDVLYNDNSGNMALASTEGVQGASYIGDIATNDMTRSLNSSDGGGSQEVVFADLSTAHPTWTNVSSFGGGDNKLEDATHFNANVVIFG